MMELNQKLAEWAGFTIGHCGVDSEIPVWLEPNEEAPTNPMEYYFGGKNYGLPSFTADLTACFKWLVPNIDIFHSVDFSQGQGKDAWIVRLWCETERNEYGVTEYDSECFNAEAETPTLALCKAIEKLIDE